MQLSIDTHKLKLTDKQVAWVRVFNTSVHAIQMSGNDRKMCDALARRGVLERLAPKQGFYSGYPHFVLTDYGKIVADTLGPRR